MSKGRKISKDSGLPHAVSLAEVKSTMEAVKARVKEWKSNLQESSSLCGSDALNVVNTKLGSSISITGFVS